MGVSRRSYAVQRGVSEAAVCKTIATGRITTLAGGTINTICSESEWCAKIYPAKQRGQYDRQMGADAAAGTTRAAANKPLPQGANRAWQRSYLIIFRNSIRVLEPSLGCHGVPVFRIAIAMMPGLRAMVTAMGLCKLLPRRGERRNSDHLSNGIHPRPSNNGPSSM